jgi:dsDNA-specific endonuclease/ATPase MutS2
MPNVMKSFKQMLEHWRRERVSEPRAEIIQPSPQAALDDEPLAFDEDPFDLPVAWEITDQIDLHHVAPREIKAVTAAYLNEAQAHGLRCVRIIHGKGIGVQREAVRGVLAQTPFVREFHDAPDASGWGATIVYLLDDENENGNDGKDKS